MSSFHQRIPVHDAPLSLDTIGIAGFSHDFRTLAGHKSSVATAFDSFGSLKEYVFSRAVFILSIIIPVLSNIPTPRNKQFGLLSSTMHQISEELLARTRKEKENVGYGHSGDKSIIGLLSW